MNAPLFDSLIYRYINKLIDGSIRVSGSGGPGQL